MRIINMPNFNIPTKMDTYERLRKRRRGRMPIKQPEISFPEYPEYPIKKTPIYRILHMPNPIKLKEGFK